MTRQPRTEAVSAIRPTADFPQSDGTQTIAETNAAPTPHPEIGTATPTQRRQRRPRAFPQVTPTPPPTPPTPSRPNAVCGTPYKGSRNGSASANRTSTTGVRHAPGDDRTTACGTPLRDAYVDRETPTCRACQRVRLAALRLILEHGRDREHLAHLAMTARLAVGLLDAEVTT